MSYQEMVAAFERRLISNALEATQGHQKRAALRLGLLPTTLHEKMKRLGLLPRLVRTSLPAATDRAAVAGAGETSVSL